MGHMPSTEREVWHLLDFLDHNEPDITGIQRELRSFAGNGDYHHAHWIKSLAQLEYGDDVIITDWRSWPPTYRTARSGPEALTYVNRRRQDVLARSRNTVNLADRGVSKFNYRPLIVERRRLRTVIAELTA